MAARLGAIARGSEESQLAGKPRLRQPGGVPINASRDDIGWRNRKCGMCSAAPDTLGMTMRARPALDRSIQMFIDPAVFDVSSVTTRARRSATPGGCSVLA
jgi:hypothetical protein